jgi:hypothetical protein
MGKVGVGRYYLPIGWLIVAIWGAKKRLRAVVL